MTNTSWSSPTTLLNVANPFLSVYAICTSECNSTLAPSIGFPSLSSTLITTVLPVSLELVLDSLLLLSLDVLLLEVVDTVELLDDELDELLDS